jgi:hypothetical protein
MTTLRVHRLVLLMVLAGCSAAASGTSGSPAGGNSSRADAGVAIGGISGSYGSGGSTGGGGMASADAAADAGLPTGDAGRGEPIPSNLSSDGPVFGADSCASCKPDVASMDAPSLVDGGRLSDAAAPAGGSGGSAGATGSGGALSASGGASGFGGSAGFGGATSAGSGGSGSGGSGVAGSGAGGAHADAGGGPDTIVPVSDAGADTGADATASSCGARIRAIVPATDSLSAFDLFAGPSVQVVLRAEITSLGPASPVWSWQCTRDGVPVTNIVLGQQDPSVAAFPIASPGNYTFTARDKTGACIAVAQAGAAGANDCPDCDRAVLLHMAPPSSADLPVQDGFLPLRGNPPFSSATIIPAVGVAARIAPSVNGGRVDAYVRVSQSGGKLITDGLAAASSGASGFPVNVVSTDSHNQVQYYDVLVVPIDGTDASTIAATAPQLFASLSAGDISRTTFSLSGGVSVTGTVTDASGAPVSDGRVILSNRNPSTPGPSSSLIFSSVGRSDAQGKFLLHAQPGTYWISISPPSGSGLPEALVPSSVTLSGDTTLSFQWDQPSTAVVALTVVDSVGMPTSGTRVRLTSAGSGKVGTLSLGSSSQPAQGNVQAQGITSSAGTVSFANVPDGTTYGVLLAPSTLGPSAATTVLSLTVPQGGTTRTVPLLPQGSIQGQLSASLTADWTQVSVVAYDRSDDSPEAPFSVLAGADGRFSIPVSPGRPYVVLALPSTASDLARTFVGPGPLAASEFTIKQKVLSSMPWISTAYQNGYDLSGTVLQVLCGPGYAGCVDSTIPLAETTIEGGAFQLALPDPSTR